MYIISVNFLRVVVGDYLGSWLMMYFSISYFEPHGFTFMELDMAVFIHTIVRTSHPSFKNFYFFKRSKPIKYLNS